MPQEKLYLPVTPTGKDRTGLLPTAPDNSSSGYSLTDYTKIRDIGQQLMASDSKRELAEKIAQELEKYPVFALQVLCGRLHHEVDRLPSPYREAVRPFFIEQLFGAHHQILRMFRNGSFRSMSGLITDRSLFSDYALMMEKACFSREIQSDYVPSFNSPYQGLFYFLVAAFQMFVLEKPGHPVGMPFPGGFRVEEHDGIYYCPVRDKEKEVPWSICNFCPAKQTDIPGKHD